MAENIAAIRFAPYGPLVFCYAERDLARGTRVRVELAGEIREGIVAIAPEQIISAPQLTDAPRVIEAIPAVDDSSRTAGIPSGNGGRLEAGGPRGYAPLSRSGEAGISAPGVIFLPADDGAIGPTDLADALRLAALPIPEPPAERR